MVNPDGFRAAGTSGSSSSAGDGGGIKVEATAQIPVPTIGILLNFHEIRDPRSETL